uniref:Uncharacterized protein n=1 Tax=Euplotes crassus TaxID=5936 RepID=A0A7S3K8S4_EUPCR|mmetsp:Transcript_15120/g.14991  ORF Transcript_15120/g.14991 Transcript_15120/m.14991 type:complete len:107 (+) Transcript_15120:290-610(+)
MDINPSNLKLELVGTTKQIVDNSKTINEKVQIDTTKSPPKPKKKERKVMKPVRIKRESNLDLIHARVLKGVEQTRKRAPKRKRLHNPSGDCRSPWKASVKRNNFLE